MLDTDTKRRIDTARDILVGKLPDPKSQVEQITIALIYKFMDDMDAQSEELGGTRSFFADDFQKYGWARLMRGGLGGHEMLNLYAEAITKMPENLGIPPLFRDIFKNAYLPYRDPETLRAFLKIIDDFEYDHSERLGDAFEYLLSVLGSQGDAGQFRTPRHIIDFIVAILDPKKGEKILDPACGTAGFLISAYKHILNANTDENGNSTLTPDDREQLAANFTGYDISPDMVRLSLVNMYLHGFADPQIHEYDTLTSDERWSERADVILANPPFMTPKGGIRPHSRFSVPSKRSEVLFLDYFVEHLTSRGRAGVIVPEGIHFVEHAGHARLRKLLISGGYLLADITLPHGVFKPYASVKTHVLIIDRALAAKTDSVLFVEVQNDGYTQSDTREPIPGSQLRATAEVVRRFERSLGDTSDTGSPTTGVRSYQVSKPTLLAGRGSHLLGRWHDLPNRVVHRPDTSLAPIRDLCDIRDGLSPNMGTLPGDYTFVVPAAERKTADHWDYEGSVVCVPLVSSAGHGKAAIKRLHFQEGQFALASTMCALFSRDAEVMRPRFLFLYLSAMCEELLVPLMKGATNVTMDSRDLRDVLVPVPPKELQDEIIESALIHEGASKIAEEASKLRSAIGGDGVGQHVERLLRDARSLAEAAATRHAIDQFLPEGRSS